MCDVLTSSSSSDVTPSTTDLVVHIVLMCSTATIMVVRRCFIGFVVFGFSSSIVWYHRLWAALC